LGPHFAIRVFINVKFEKIDSNLDNYDLSD